MGAVLGICGAAQVCVEINYSKSLLACHYQLGMAVNVYRSLLNLFCVPVGLLLRKCCMQSLLLSLPFLQKLYVNTDHVRDYAAGVYSDVLHYAESWTSNPA